MHSIIKILSPHESIKIAAGEVIERPANIIKELIENSIDAQAKNITIHIKNAGKTFIQIIDDGCGMSPDDAVLCFAQHATSKISTVEDLQSIATYGFRGEALASIAAVSSVTLQTKQKQNKTATQVCVKFGFIQNQSLCNHPTGSTITITDLFENIPARKKFLKADDTEWTAIATIFQAFALRFCSISFKLFHNDQLVYQCPATQQLKIRCAQLWNNQLHEQLLLLPETNQENITFSGAISAISYQRFNRGQIFTFVNNRWVKNAELIKAIMKGFDGVLPAGKFPAAFIFITIDPDQIDVNIHPKKEEVKFLHPEKLQKLIQKIIETRLSEQNKTLLSIPEPTKTVFFTQPQSPFLDENKDRSHLKGLDDKTEKKIDPYIREDDRRETIFTELRPTPSNILAHKPESASFSSQIALPFEMQDDGTIIGQFQKTYILFEKSDRLILIDQHSAHERILYNRFKNNLQEISIIALLFPHIIKLQSDQIASISKHQKVLTQHGIMVDQFSEQEIIVQQTPVGINGQTAQEIIFKMLGWIEQFETATPNDLHMQLHEKMLAERACKSAVKAGDTLSHEQMSEIIKQLRATDQNFCCPHGRPTIWSLLIADIEKHFKRDYTGTKEIIL